MSESKNDGYAFIVGAVQAGRAAEAMGGIGHQQTVADPEEGVQDPVLVWDRVPGGVHFWGQGRSAAATENGR